MGKDDSIIDDSHAHADHGELLINTGTGTGSGPQIPRDVIADGASTVNTNRAAGAIDTDSALAQPWRTGASRAFSDQTIVPWALLIRTGTDTINGAHRGAQIAGGAGSVIADGATTVNTNNAGAVDTGGALAQPWRTASRAFSDQTIVPWALLIRTGTDTINGAHRGAQIAGGAGSVIAKGAATVNTIGAGAINTPGALAQYFSRTAGGAFSDQMPIPRHFALKTGTSVARASGIVIKAKPGSTINFGPGAQIVIADGASAVNTNSAAAVNIYEDGGSNIYYSAVVAGTTCLLIGFGLGTTASSPKKLGARVAVAVGISLKRKVR